MSKIAENIVLQQLLAYLTDHNLTCYSQSTHNCTETALLKVTIGILLALYSGSVSFLTLLDLSASSNTIDHLILTNRFQQMYGIAGTTLS